MKISLRSLYKDLKKVTLKNSRFRENKFGVNWKKGLKIVGGAAVIAGTAYSANALKERQQLYGLYRKIMVLSKENGNHVSELQAYGMAFMLIHPKNSAYILTNVYKNDEEYKNMHVTESSVRNNLQNFINQINLNMNTKFEHFNSQGNNVLKHMIEDIIKYKKWDKNTPPKLSETEIKEEKIELKEEAITKEIKKDKIEFGRRRW